MPGEHNDVAYAGCGAGSLDRRLRPGEPKYAAAWFVARRVARLIARAPSLYVVMLRVIGVLQAWHGSN